MTESIAANLIRVRARLAEAALRVGRDPAAVTLVAVSKTFPAAAARAAWEAGQRDFGENRVEEALPKLVELGALDGARWHLIGHLQSRKTNDFGGEFALIHSVDSLRLATRLSARAVAQARRQDILLECNVSGEASKDGFPVSGWERDAVTRDAFLAQVRTLRDLPGVRVRGLMTMAPIVATSAEARPFFASLRALRDQLREALDGHDAPILSMGMSDDFEAAIAEGATHIRVGRAIFGTR